MIAERLSERLGLPLLASCVRKIRPIPELKNVYDLDQRMQLLAGVFEVDASQAAGKRVLLFDDLYRSGATMNAIAALLYDQGHVADVFALTLTRTRVLQ
jgi:competence protein ComFC